MASPVAQLYNRTFRRHRYVPDVGWVVSNTTFNARVQPKFNDSIQRTREVNQVDCFLNVIVFRDNDDSIDSYVGDTYSFPTPAEAAAAAQSGTSIAIGDRLVEDSTGYMLIVRGVTQLRDFKLQHDEITCSEASQYDKKWIEPIQIHTQKDLSEEGVGVFYDSIRRQYIKIDVDADTNTINAFGIIEPFDLAKFDRDMKVIDRTDAGKEYNDRMIFSIDADFFQNVLDEYGEGAENTTLYARGKHWKVEYRRDSLTRVLTLGVTAWKQRGASDDSPRILPSRSITT